MTRQLLKEGSHLRRLQPVGGWCWRHSTGASSKKAAIYDGCNDCDGRVLTHAASSSKKAAIYDGCNSPTLAGTGQGAAFLKEGSHLRRLQLPAGTALSGREGGSSKKAAIYDGCNPQ